MDAYRASLGRSLESARRHDQLTQRLHAAESARTLVRLLFALEGQRPPPIDALPDALSGIEAVQDWPAGYLRWALLNLVRDPSPRRQLELARRVERLLQSRADSTGATGRTSTEMGAGRHVGAGAPSRAP